jgi:hypothetical protein
MHGSAPCTAAASAAASTTPARPARGEAHLWIPAGAAVGNAVLLLAVALDVDGGWPDNCSDTARLFDVTREAVRAWRDRLVAAAFATLEGGRIVPTDRARSLLRCSDPLPRRLLRGNGPRPSPQVLRACASLTADTIGPRSERRGVRTDRERADAVGVGEKAVRAARRLLVSLGLLAAKIEQRGRARVVRVVAELDKAGKPRSAHGSTPAESRLRAAVERAERGRAGLRRGANGRPSVGAKQTTSPMQSPTETLPMQAPSAPARRRRDRAADAARAYWNNIDKLAADTLSARAAEIIVEQLDAQAAGLGKSPDEVEQDMARMRELRQLDGAAVAKQRSELPARFAAADARIKRAEAAVERAVAELEAARTARQPIEGDALAAKTAANRLDLLRRELASSGCPHELLEAMAPKGAQ